MAADDIHTLSIKLHDALHAEMDTRKSKGNRSMRKKKRGRRY